METTEVVTKPKKARKAKAVEPVPAQDQAPAPSKPAADILGNTRKISRLIKMTADPSRLAILLNLRESGSMNVGRIGEILGTTQPAVSHHLALLRASHIVEDTRDGKYNFYALTDIGRAAADAIVAMASALDAV